MKEEPVLIIKPNLINTLFPTFLKNILFIGSGAGIVFLITISLRSLEMIEINTTILTGSLIIITLFLSFILISWKIIKLITTKYIFYHTHIIIEKKLFNVHRTSVIYNQITNITTKLNVWDRFSNGGKIILHTAEDNTPDLELYSVNNTQTIEKKIHLLIKNAEKTEKEKHTKK